MTAILKQGWQLYSQHFGFVAAVVIAVWLPVELLSSYMDQFVFGEDNWQKSIRFAIFLENFFGIIATAGVIAIGYFSLTGGPLTFGTALGMGAASWGRMWWTRLIVGLALMGGLLLLIIPGLYLIVRLALVEPVIVCERVYGPTAMRRSFDLTKGRFWQVFRLGLVLLGVLLTTAVLGVVPTVLIPALDHWLVDAAVQLVGDIIGAFCTLCLLSAYVKFSTEEKLSSPAPVLQTREEVA
jgi:hypothetical protein